MHQCLHHANTKAHIIMCAFITCTCPSSKQLLNLHRKGANWSFQVMLVYFLPKLFLDFWTFCTQYEYLFLIYCKSYRNSNTIMHIINFMRICEMSEWHSLALLVEFALESIGQGRCILKRCARSFAQFLWKKQKMYF